MRIVKYSVLTFFLCLWQLFSSLGLLPKYQIPSPFDIYLGFSELLFVGLPQGYTLPKHALHSLYRVFCGFSLAALVATPLGICMGWSRWVRTIIEPLVEMIRPIPPLAWIPISILWFGIGIQSAAFIIFLGVFFPILLNTISGVLGVDRLLIEASQTLGAKDRNILLKIISPGAMPFILTGLRIGMGIGWMTLVAAEFTGVKTGYGLGHMIMTARDIQRPDEIVAGMILIGLIGYLLDGLFRIAEAKVLKWR